MKIEVLKTKLQEIIERIPKNQLEISEVNSRIVKAEEKFQRLNGIIEGLRRERQKVLAVAGDVKNINASITKTKNEHELLEDEIIGLKTRLEELEMERERLAKEKLVTERNILKEEVVRPLVEKYSTAAKQLANILTNLEEAIFKASLLRADGEEEKIVFTSCYNWDGALAFIPSLFMSDEQSPGNIYIRRDVTERLRAMHLEEKGAQKQAQQATLNHKGGSYERDR